jgi:serine/threonine protein kinase
MDPTNLTPVGDQYSLGCVLYYCLAGRYPFPDGTAVEKMMSHQHKQPDSLKELAPETPDGLIEVVEKLMAKNPEDRYASTADVVQALRPFAEQAPSKRALPGAKPLAPSSRLPASAPVPTAKLAPASTPPPVAIPVARAANPQAAEVNARLAGLRPGRTASVAPQAQPPAQRQDPATQPPVATPARRSWDQRLGPIGIALIAIIAGAAAWLLSSFVGK